MTITHILKDGTRTETIQGHVVQIDLLRIFSESEEGEKHGNQKD